MYVVCIYHVCLYRGSHHQVFIVQRRITRKLCFRYCRCELCKLHIRTEAIVQNHRIVKFFFDTRTWRVLTLLRNTATMVISLVFLRNIFFFSSSTVQIVITAIDIGFVILTSNAIHYVHVRSYAIILKDAYLFCTQYTYLRIPLWI